MSLHDLIFKNFWLKLFSLILATLIWFTVWSNLEKEARLPWRTARSDRYRDFADQPVLVLANGNDKQPYRIDPARVRVTVRGSEAALDKLKPADLEVFVRPLGVGEPTGPLDVQVRAPVGVAVVQVQPSSVSVESLDAPK